MRTIAAGTGLAILAVLPSLMGARPLRADPPVYRSPLVLAVSPDGRTLYVSDRTAGCVTVVDPAIGKPVKDIALGEEPCGLALSADGRTLYVALRQAHAVALIDTASGQVTGRIPVGHWPVALALGAKGKRLYTCNRGDHTVSAVDLAAGREVKRVPVVREPSCAAVTPDESRVVVTNLLPAGAGTDVRLAAEVSILDASALSSSQVKLPAGSTVVTGVCTSPDGRWAYAVHTLGRFNLPITQLERGWVHTYALSILDVPAGKLLATLLLDDLGGGAADPWAVVRSADGRTLWISHAGIDQVSRIDTALVHELLEGRVPPEVAKVNDGLRENVWVEISRDRRAIAKLGDDLTALHVAGAIRRFPAGGQGPRGLALSPDGRRLCVANYFSGTVGVLDATSGRLLGALPLGPQPQADAARRGEIYFHDATRSFQAWHSCATCHPDGRVDGLPWDFMRDGIGNGKDVVSLVLMHQTSPHNRRATRADPRECMRTGVTGSHLVVPAPADVEDLTAYAASLKPEPNPLGPALAEAAARGKRLFEGKAQCAGCHPAPLFTDNKTRDVGIHTPNEPDGQYDTPSLVEVYRTAPYFHDGRAATLKDVLTTHDPGEKHGLASLLTPQEREDLIAYLLSL